MSYLQHISGLTGRRVFGGTELKTPYGALGKTIPLVNRVVNQAAPLVNKTEVPDSVLPATPSMPQAPPVLAPEITESLPAYFNSEGGGGNMGSPATGSTTIGQDAVASANPQQGIDAAKGVGKIGLGMVAPDVATAIGKATQSVPAAIGSYGLMGLFSSGHPVLGIANLGFSTAAQAMANADMADAIDNGDIGSDLAGVHNSLTPSNRSPSDDLANIGFEMLGSKTNKAIQDMHQAKTNPLSFIGQRMWSGIKDGRIGESWDENSLMDNIAKETISPGSTEPFGTLGMSQYSQFDPKTNTYSTPEGASAHQSGYGLGKSGADLGLASQADIDSASQAATDATNASQAAQQGMDDAESNSIDGGFFSGGDAAASTGSSDVGYGADQAGGEDNQGQGSGGTTGGVSASDSAGYGASNLGGEDNQGGDSGGKIVCSAMNELYGFGHERNVAWLKYSKIHLKPEHAAGYHFIFKPLVKIGFKSGNKWYHLVLRKTLEHIATHRTDDLNAAMKGTKRDSIGRIERFFMEPICYWTGRLIGWLNGNK